jgi:uncharacterized membrane protein
MTNKWYNFLKFVALILLPGLGTLYVGLAGLWNLPKVDEVTGTVVVVDTFLGLLVRYFAQKYANSDEKYDGVIDIEYPEDGVPVANLNLTEIEDPLDVVHKDELLFKVNAPQPPPL